MDFLFVGIQRINTGRESTSTSLARELARQGHRVLYVNSPLARKTFFLPPQDPFAAAHLHELKTKANPLQLLSSNLWVLNPTRMLESFNWVPSTALFSWLIEFNNQRFALDIKPALHELQFEDIILINDKDIFRSFYLKELLQPRHYIYLDRDYTMGIPYWRKHGKALEPALMRKSDAVFCNSLDFTEHARRYNSNSFNIGNGFDAEQFNDNEIASIPVDLAAIPTPRIGYIGALTTLRLDLALLTDLARARPAWSFVLVGREDEAFARSALHNFSNVFFLGQKHTHNVPDYLQHLDVCINPQKLNDITRGNFPLKILEYLALGKPVVATTTNTMTEVFRDHTYLATSSAEFITQIENALSKNTLQRTEERKDFVKKFSWKNIVELVVNHLQELQEPVKIQG